MSNLTTLGIVLPDGHNYPLIETLINLLFTIRKLIMPKYNYLNFAIIFLLASVCVFAFSSTIHSQVTEPCAPTCNVKTTCGNSWGCDSIGRKRLRRESALGAKVGLVVLSFSQSA